MGRQGARAVPVLQLAVPLPRGVAVGAPTRERAGDQVPAQRARAAHGRAVVVVKHQADEQAVLVVRPAAVVATAVPARRLLRLRPAPRGGTAAGSCQELRGLRARPRAALFECVRMRDSALPPVERHSPGTVVKESSALEDCVCHSFLQGTAQKRLRWRERPAQGSSRQNRLQPCLLPQAACLRWCSGRLVCRDLVRVQCCAGVRVLAAASTLNRLCAGLSQHGSALRVQRCVA